ncbi:hypothetical protein RD792_014293 [Penstemon davidsonii]|uniref:Aluminum-activated malate transporter n=1 Tax=Penstemon davidsonii TaxID=160366 RepID=A0ABR0CP48_9LAMI|nr:hypothetical protein RD792_014293 [Penstemon davidsonii]
MEMNTPNQEKKLGFVEYTCLRFKAMFGWIKSMAVDIVKKTKKIGKDDPRRIVHSMKVGLALTLVSLFYYFRPLYDGFGQAGMWAVLTVVVVFEFTVGGTLSKSINRGCATLVAGALGVGAEYLAGLCGEKGEPIVLGILVFILGKSISIPKNKKRRRITRFGGEFFNFPGSGNGTVSSKDDDKSFLKSYKSVLNSKATEESLVALEFHAKIQQPCTILSMESGKALKELATAIKNMTYPSSAVQSHIENSKAAADDIKTILENSSLPTKADLQEIMPVLVTASVLIDNIKCVEKISVSILELSQKARFIGPKSTDGPEKQQQLLHRGIVKPVDDVIGNDDDHVVIEITPKDSITREKAGVNMKF